MAATADGPSMNVEMRTELDPHLANRLRVVRAERDLSQGELAHLVGVSRQTISSIETGQYTPSALLALLIADALEKPVTDLFWIEGGTR